MRDGENPGARSPEADARARVEHWQTRAARGVWPLVAFAAVSVWAVAGFPYVPRPPAAWNDVLGQPPPPAWVNAAFVLYIFSALILGLTRIGAEAKVSSGFAHVGYLSAFYGFYGLAGVLRDNVWAVLVGGFAVLTLEWYRGWLYCREQIRGEGSGEGPGAPSP